MPLNFPSTPTNGQTYTVGNQTWTYNSAQGKWLSQNYTPIVVSASTPTGKLGQLWYDTNDGTLMIYDGARWVQAAGFSVPSDALTSSDIGSTVLAYNANILTTTNINQDVARAWTYGTAITLSSAGGEFFNIPSGVTQIDVFTKGVSLSGSGTLHAQLGVNGVYNQSGYRGVTNQIANAAFGNVLFPTAGVGYAAGAAADVTDAVVQFMRADSNSKLWIAVQGGQLTSSTALLHGASSITLTGDPTSVRLVTSSTFDAGTMNIRYR